MLSLSKMAGGQERYYLELGREDYYLEGGEPSGRWYGKGAASLGLVGTVLKDHLRALMQGQGPHGEDLGQVQNYRDGRERTPGWDLTFSAPKSVSVLWSQAPEDLRGALQAAHGSAVREALSYLEEVAAVARRGRGGTETECVSFAVATFEHGTSRCLDPQLHTHCLVLNLAPRQDGTWGALRSRDLFQHKMAAGALYRLALAQGLRELGLELRAERSWFEIAKVPAAVSEFFSKRRAEIEQLLGELGADGPRAAEKLALTTREVKGHVARAELFPRWQEEGAARGFGPKETRALQGHRLPEKSLSSGTIREAMRELTDTESTFAEKDLVRRVAEKVQAQGVSPHEVLTKVREFLRDPKQVVSLAAKAGSTPLYTDPSLYAKERDVLALAEALHARQSHAVSKRSRLESSLNEEQREALSHLTSSGALKVLSGMAGSGKTFLLDAARDTWEHSGYTVLGAALSGRAARELAEGAHIKCSTIESLLYRLEPSLKRTLSHHARMLLREATGRPTWKLPRLSLDKRTVLVVDEATMVGTRHLAMLIRAVERAGAKLVLAGDERQLQSVEAGGSFIAFKERFGAAELHGITRQHEEWMRDAVRQFASGDARAGLTQYALADRLHVAKTREHAIEALVQTWRAKRTERLSETLILANTNNEVDELNRRIQRLRADELGARFTAGQRTYYEGDRVLFNASSRRLGVLNGDFGTVETVHGNRFCVRLDRQQTTVLGRSDIRIILGNKDLTLRAFGEERELLRLGYATTAHKAQGATVERAFVFAGGSMEDREMAYVQMSRARELAYIITDEATAGEDLTELARSMERSNQKLLAHDQALNQSLGLAL